MYRDRISKHSSALFILHTTIYTDNDMQYMYLNNEICSFSGMTDEVFFFVEEKND